MRTLAVVVLIVLAALAPTLADDSSGCHGDRCSPPPCRRDDCNGASERRAEDRWNRTSPEARDRGLARADGHHLFSQIRVVGDLVTGRYLSFHLNDTTGAITNFLVLDGRTVPLFSSIVPSAFHASRSPRATGAALDIPGENLSASVHNNPTLELRYEAGAPVTVTFHFANGTANGTGREVELHVGALDGHLLANGNGSLQVGGGTITASLKAGDTLLFRLHPQGGDEKLMRAEDDAFKSHLLGSALRIADGGGAAVMDEASDGVGADTQEIRHGHLTLNISSDQHQERVLFLSVDPETLPGADASHVAVNLSGVPLTLESSVDAAIATPGSAFVEADNSTGGVQVAVHVAHFSSYALVLADIVPPAPTTSDAAGTSSGGSGQAPAISSATHGAPAGLAVAVVALAFALLRRTR
ncbi:MAG: hypothetical protein ACYDBQ_04110 [Thermoplasmatota archaeon]